MDLLSLKKQIAEMKPTNRHPVYESHLYWSQKPYNICDQLIEALTEKGDIVFDPFMGSGVTVIEAALLARKGVGVEINELPIFIVDTIMQRIEDSTIVEKTLNDFSQHLRKLNIYYETWSEDCNQEGIIKKVIFDRESPFAEPDIKEIHYQCQGKMYTKKPDLFDIQNMLGNKHYECIQDYNMVANSRLGVQKNQNVTTLFTARVLTIIDEVLQYIHSIREEGTKNILKYILMSSLHLIKVTDLKSNSQWPLWTPKTNALEKNAVDVLIKRTNLFYETYRHISESLPSIRKADSFAELQNGSNYQVIYKGTQHLTQEDIPDHSVDLVITDPPYLGQVLYSEYMQLYYPFLGLGFNLEDEIVISTAVGREKDEQTYFELLRQSFQKISQKLKDDKILCMYFHDSHLSVWNKLVQMMKGQGLHFFTQVHVPKKVTLKNILSPKKSLQGDSILFFIKKPAEELPSGQTESIDEIVQKVVSYIQRELKHKGPLTTPQLMDNGLMEYIIHNGWLETLSRNYKDLVEVMEPKVSWDQNSGKWCAEV